MIRSAKRKVGVTQGAVASFSPPSSSKKSKLDVPSSQNVGDIEDLPNFVHHKDAMHQFSQNEIQGVRTNLLKWYDSNKRTLPWRSVWTSDLDEAQRNVKAYQVWVSEIMLQQTRVATVIDYFNKWVAKWPTLQDLANASLEEVNEMWSGLGYYRRARFLHSGAQQVIKEYKGLLPAKARDLEAISGIGKYTAGAISSIAFNEVSPLVDGNVIRVISRLRAIAGNSKAQKTTQLFWKLAEDLVDPARPGCFNQALMEFGATLCTPTSPQCSSCPLSAYCLGTKFVKEKQKASKDAKMECSVCEDFDTKRLPITDVTMFPVKLAKKGPRLESVVVSIVEREVKEGEKKGEKKGEKEYLIVRRPHTGLLAGLWEAPSVVLEEKESEEESESEEEEEEKKKKRKKAKAVATSTEVSEEVMREKINGYLKDELKMSGFKVEERMWVGEVVHVFSHIKQTLRVEYLSVSGDIKLESLPKQKKIESDDDFISDDEQKKKKKVKKSKEEDSDEEEQQQKKKKSKKSKESEPKEVRWVGAEEFHKSAVSKQMRKCFEAFEKFEENGKKEVAGSKKAKKKEVKVDNNQKSIASFFTAKKK